MSQEKNQINELPENQDLEDFDLDVSIIIYLLLY